MRKEYELHLFRKGLFVGEEEGAEAESVSEALEKLFAIRITEHAERASLSMIRLAEEALGADVPEAFYRGFPASVRELSSMQKLYDQLLHYTQTYGLGNFESAGSSVLEEAVQRTAMKEEVPEKRFRIIGEEEAERLLAAHAENLCAGTRPLPPAELELLYLLTGDKLFSPKRCASKDTALQMLAIACLRETELSPAGLSADPHFFFAAFILLPDLIRFAEYLVYYGTEGGIPDRSVFTRLRLTARGRKCFLLLLRRLLERDEEAFTACFEKRKAWKGILHQLHFKPRTKKEEAFARAMFTGKNESVSARFEKALAEKGPVPAAELLLREKGSGALLRALDYLFSRCESEAEIESILSMTETKNAVILLQLLLRYAGRENGAARTFRFSKFFLLRVHQETPKECARRKSRLLPETAARAREVLRTRLQALYKNRLGTVYVDEDMKKTALPLKESTSMQGVNRLPSGSRRALPEGKKIRAFTYWELVNDIDLSVIGLSGEGEMTEFSWRTMAERGSGAIIYSGDQTSGYHGGSEYFDIDTELFAKEYPKIRHLVFCNNVYSDSTFAECFCRAGFMLRDREDSGEIFEPKTVESAYTINCASRYAFLFAFDLQEREMIWLNIGRDSIVRVAGAESPQYLMEVFSVTEVINVYDLFAMQAERLTDNPEEALLVVSDREVRLKEGAEQIRSGDIARIAALMQ